jgi:hypothetical protein
MRHTSQIVALQGHDRANIGTGRQHLTNSPQIAQTFFADIAGDQHIDRGRLAGNP